MKGVNIKGINKSEQQNRCRIDSIWKCERTVKEEKNIRKK